MNIKIAIVGCGRIGERHAKHISSRGELVAVCDNKIDKANSLANQYKCNSYQNLEEMLNSEKELDIVAVCTPNGLHKEHSIMILKKGIDVVCEKPMALSVSDCEAMINESLNSGSRLFIVKQNRFNPPVKKVKELIENGNIGEIINVQLNCFWNRNENYYSESDWKGTKKLDGGILFTQFSHFIDIMYYLVGDVQDANGLLNNKLHQGIIEFEDQGVVNFSFKNGAIGTMNYNINCYKKNMEGSITIFGSKATVKIGGQYLNELEYQSIEDHVVGELEKGNSPNNYGEYVGSMSNHDKVYDNVVDVLTNKGKIATNALEGLKTVEIIEKIYSNSKLI